MSFSSFKWFDLTSADCDVFSNHKTFAKSCYGSDWMMEKLAAKLVNHSTDSYHSIKRKRKLQKQN